MITTFDTWHANLPLLEIHGTEGSLSLPDPNTFAGPVRLRLAQDEAWRDVPLTHGYTEQSRSIGVADMADAVGYSLYHFCRTFNEATHHTPYDYLMRRRLSEAARTLLQADDRIIDVALDHQFSNPETFSRAFRRMFDTQPSQWRKDGCLDRWRLMPRLTLAHLAQIAKGPYLRPVLEERAPFRVVGLMTMVREERSAIAELWMLLGDELAACADLAEAGDCYGVAWHPPGWEQRGFLYMADQQIYYLNYRISYSFKDVFNFSFKPS